MNQTIIFPQTNVRMDVFKLVAQMIFEKKKLNICPQMFSFNDSVNFVTQHFCYMLHIFNKDSCMLQTYIFGRRRLLLRRNMWVWLHLLR